MTHTESQPNWRSEGQKARHAARRVAGLKHNTKPRT